jgi:hypothetical protein
MKAKTSTPAPKATAGSSKRRVFRKVPERLMAEDRLTSDQVKLCETFEQLLFLERGDGVRITLGEMPGILHRIGVDTDNFDFIKMVDMVNRCNRAQQRVYLIQWLEENLPEGLNRMDPPPTEKERKYLTQTLCTNQMLERNIILAMGFALLRCLPVLGVPMSSAAYGRDHVCLQ